MKKMSLAFGAALLTLSARALGADEVQKEPHDTPHEDAFRIGAIGGVGFPRPLAIEPMIEVERVLALGVEYGALPKTSLGGVETSLWSLSGDLRVFPFKGAFFVGARVGHQTIDASTTINYPTLPATESATASAWFVNPRAGFLWTFDSGFTIGIDAGISFPIDATVTTSVPAPLDASVARVASALGNGTTPTIDLLRIGLLF